MKQVVLPPNVSLRPQTIAELPATFGTVFLITLYVMASIAIVLSSIGLVVFIVLMIFRIVF